MRVRGLKRIHNVQAFAAGDVAPRAGAWIETLRQEEIVGTGLVAPRAGAWIETQMDTTGFASS